MIYFKIKMTNLQIEKNSFFILNNNNNFSADRNKIDFFLNRKRSIYYNNNLKSLQNHMKYIKKKNNGINSLINRNIYNDSYYMNDIYYSQLRKIKKIEKKFIYKENTLDNMFLKNKNLSSCKIKIKRKKGLILNKKKCKVKELIQKTLYDYFTK